MLKQWTDTFKAATSGGTLPLDKPARAMRYKRALIWKVDVSTLGISGQVGKGSWTVEITDESGAIVFFKSKVTLSLFLVSLGVSGLSLFTWNFVKDEFDTTRVAAFDTDKTNIGKFMGGGTAQSEQGDLRPASGQDSTNGIATIITDWYSPIYVFKSPGRPFPPRAKVKITKDTWGFGPASVEYGWAFDEAAATPVGTIMDGLGSLVVGCSGAGFGRQGSGSVHTARSWPLGDFKHLDPLAPVKGDYPTFHELGDGRLVQSVLGVEGVIEYQSQTSGLNWERVRYTSPESATPQPANVFSAGVDMPTSLKIDDDTRLHIAVKDGKLMWNIVNAEGVGHEQIVGAIPDEDTSLPSLEQTRDGGFLIIGGGGIPIYEANSLPPDWQKVKTGGSS